MRPFCLDRAFALAATLAVAIGLGAGFWLVGGPGRQRAIAADQQRWQDLTTIAVNLHQGYLANTNHYRLPPELMPDGTPTDPITSQPYDYLRLSDLRYQLCASFATDSHTNARLKDPQRPYRGSRQHPQGRYCRDFDVSRSPD